MRRPLLFFFFFFNDTATTEIYTLSLHDALPISVGRVVRELEGCPRAEVEQRVAAQGVHHQPVGVHHVEHQGGAADERLERRGRAPAHHAVLRLEHDVAFDADHVGDQVAEPYAAAGLVAEGEGGVGARVGAERADLELTAALGRDTAGATPQHERSEQQRHPSHDGSSSVWPHGSWCSSTRRFWARPAAVVFVAIGELAPYPFAIDRKSTRLNSSHSHISYAVFC